ncbi:MFS transporter [Amaricoccus macauensis]|uniref:MFS transporter n=1 Tax=Amaricoccus macauensis TaxID=57001 RepID=UPI003C7B1D05
MMPGKARSVGILAVVEVMTMSLWFVSAAILPELIAEGDIGHFRAALLTSAVQIGFVLGALGMAVHGTPDRIDPRRVIAVCAVIGSVANLALLVTPIGGVVQVLLRGITGICLAGVYPVGMKIIVGWGTKDRGLLVGLLVGALTLGSALPHLFAFLGGTNWRVTVAGSSALALVSAGLALMTSLGPAHAQARAFDPGAIRMAWTDRRIRLAYAGYLGHMWELYTYWAWIGAALAVSFSAQLALEDAQSAAKLVTFVAIALGGVMCVPAGWFADRIGKAQVAKISLIVSGVSGLATAAAFGGPVWLVAALAILWGASVIPDSAQFSALVADSAPPDRAGSLMTFQTAIGFTMTFFTVQAMPFFAQAFGWQAALAIMVFGPIYGIDAMRRLIRIV